MNRHETYMDLQYSSYTQDDGYRTYFLWLRRPITRQLVALGKGYLHAYLNDNISYYHPQFLN